MPVQYYYRTPTGGVGSAEKGLLSGPLISEKRQQFSSPHIRFVLVTFVTFFERAISPKGEPFPTFALEFRTPL